MQRTKKRSIFGIAVDQARPEVIRTVDERLAFLRRVYGWMFGGVLATVLGISVGVQSGIAMSVLQSGLVAQILMMVVWIAGAALVQRVRHKPTWNVIAFAAYAFYTGIFISTTILLAMILGQNYTGSSATYIMQAGGLTLVVFGGLSAYAFFTKRDFSFMRGMLVVGTFVLLGAIVMGFFIQSSALHIAISSFGVLLFAGYTLYDTQKVLREYPSNEHVQGAMTLFTDFVLLFLYILSLILQLAGGGGD